MSATTDGPAGGVEERFQLTVDPDEPIITDPRADKKEPTPDELKEQLAAAQVKLGQTRAELDMAQTALTRPITVTAPAVERAADTPDPRAQYQEYLKRTSTKLLTGDAEGALQDVFGLVDTIVQDRLGKANFGLAEGNARNTVRMYKASAKMDDPVAQEFDAMVNDAVVDSLGKIPPAQQEQALDALFDMAIGKATRKKQANGRTEAPPPYGTGAASASGQRPGGIAKSLSPVQREYVRSARDAGIPEDRIRKTLDEFENEGL